MTILTEAPLSLDDYLALPDDGRQYEVVEGILIVNPSPMPRHQLVLYELQRAVSPILPDDYVLLQSPIDWVLRAEAPAQIRQPDAVVVARSELGGRNLDRPPLVAIEVLSPSSGERDLIIKRRAYAEAGCRHYWIIDPAMPAALALRLEGGAYVEAARAEGEEVLGLSDPFAGSFSPADLVRGLPES